MIRFPSLNLGLIYSCESAFYLTPQVRQSLRNKRQIAYGPFSVHFNNSSIVADIHKLSTVLASLQPLVEN